MRVVLDNVEQGLAMVSADGTMGAERSLAFDRLFGTPESDEHFADRVASHSATVRTLTRLAWEALVEGFLPTEVVLEQFPKTLERDGKHLTMSFNAMESDGQVQGALLMVSDVTTAVEAMREQEKQREYVAVFERAMRDPGGLEEFVAETGKLVEVATKPEVTSERRLRVVHTVKGNAAQWDVASVSKVAHQLETQLIEERAMPCDRQLSLLADNWRAFAGRASGILEALGTTTRIDVSRSDVDALLELVRDPRVDRAGIELAVDRLRHEPTRMRFERLKEQVASLAKRLKKPMPIVLFETNDLRLPASRFAAFWQSLVHVVRNAMDHGIEAPEVREGAGKPKQGTITLRTLATSGDIIVEISDDGRGIDWTRIQQKATFLGLRVANAHDLQVALFSNGVSTAAEVTDVSGRGVGLGATRDECVKLGGRVEVTSDAGKGTSFSFRFPRKPNEVSIAPSGASHPASAAR
jgi:two-component system chemotaxis sensor kinase CheA